MRTAQEDTHTIHCYLVGVAGAAFVHVNECVPYEKRRRRVIAIPCDTIQTTSITWNKQTSPELLLKAMQAMGLTAHQRADGTINANGRGVVLTYDTLTHTMIARGAAFDEAELKRAYSEAVVDHVAVRMAWRKSNVANKERTYLVQRRK